jgi:hypothetical protein
VLRFGSSYLTDTLIMGTTKSKVDKEELRRLLKEDRTKGHLDRIGAHFGVGAIQVRKMITKYELEGEYNPEKIFTDLVGQRFGALVVVDSKQIVGRHKHLEHLCQCDCGNTKIFSTSNLKCRVARSCGCLSTKFVDLTGMKFGEYTVLSVVRDKRSNFNGKVIVEWLCECSCGHRAVHNTVAIKSIYGCFNCSEKCKAKFHGLEEISKTFWSSVQAGAASRALPFEITIEYGWDLFLKQNRKCALSGVDLTFMRTKRHGKSVFQTASLDRIDSSLGYLIGNVQWVHKRINTMKKWLDDNEFMDWCHKISDHQRSLIC